MSDRSFSTALKTRRLEISRSRMRASRGRIEKEREREREREKRRWSLLAHLLDNNAGNKNAYRVSHQMRSSTARIRGILAEYSNHAMDPDRSRGHNVAPLPSPPLNPASGTRIRDPARS